jgi:hypothetical protein
MNGSYCGINGGSCGMNGRYCGMNGGSCGMNGGYRGMNGGLYAEKEKCPAGVCNLYTYLKNHALFTSPSLCYNTNIFIDRRAGLTCT